jgi:hypothetical protein
MTTYTSSFLTAVENKEHKLFFLVRKDQLKKLTRQYYKLTGILLSEIGKNK